MKMPMSQIGNSYRWGYSLLELLVVMSIIGIIISVAVPTYQKVMPRLKVTSALRQLALDLRYARNLAITKSDKIDVTFYPEQHKYAFNNTTRKLDVDVEITYKSCSAKHYINNFVLRFYPDGSSCDSSIVLYKEKRKADLTINGWTGVATVHEE